MGRKHRRTPPIPVQVIDPFIWSNARFKKRLIDFDTGCADIEAQHEAFLLRCMTALGAESGFQLRLFGYASRLGNAAFNHMLGLRRMNSVLSFMQMMDHRSLSSVEQWYDYGSDQSMGKGNDDSPQWRAVEVHIFTGPVPPTPPPPHVTPVNPQQLRGKKWSVSAYFGLMTSVFYVAQFGVSLYKFRNDETGEVRTYLSPMCGAGGSVDILKIRQWLKALGDKKIPGWAHVEYVVEQILKEPQKLLHPYETLKEIVKAFFTSTSVSDWTDFSKCEVYLPLSFNLLDGKTIANASFTGSIYQVQKLWVYGQVWYEDQRGKMFGNHDLLNVSTSGWQAQVPALGSGFVGGPLLML